MKKEDEDEDAGHDSLIAVHNHIKLPHVSGEKNEVEREITF